MKKLLSIDPGVEAGWALWDLSLTGAPPIRTGLIMPGHRYPSHHNEVWQGRVEQVCDYFQNRFWGSEKEVAIEWPAFHGSAAGETVATSGSLVKLTYAVGAIARVFESQDIPVRLVPVAEWKGQMPKTAVEYRIKKILGEEACKGFRKHVWDAVGIGLHVKGEFQ